MTFGQRLKKVRKERGITQKTLADIVGTTRETISKYELDEREPPLSKAVSLSRALNINLLYLAGLTNEEYLNLTSLSRKTCSDIKFILRNNQND